MRGLAWNQLPLPVPTDVLQGDPTIEEPTRAVVSNDEKDVLKIGWS